MITFAEFAEGIPIILSLIIIEGLLSVDNALAIAAMASKLPEHERRLALRLGILGAYVFRALALAIAGWIIQNPWIKLFGAAYLIYLMCAHLTGKHRESAQLQSPKQAQLWPTVFSIELMDLSLSVDNVVAAVALSSKLWVVYTGVFIGILALRLLAGYCIDLMKRFPILASTAFLLVGYVGLLLVVQIVSGHELGSAVKFTGIALIVAATLFYERSSATQRVLAPVIKAAHFVMWIISSAVEGVFWPLHALFSVWRRTNGVKRPGESNGSNGS